MSNNLNDPLEGYNNPISIDLVEVDIEISDTPIHPEPSILGLSPEKEEEFFFTLFFDQE